MSTPTVAQLKRALGISKQIEALQRELTSILGGTPSKAAQGTAAKETFKRSPETIARMKAAQQARRATVKGKQAPTSTKKAPNSKAGPQKPEAHKAPEKKNTHHITRGEGETRGGSEGTLE